MTHHLINKWPRNEACLSFSRFMHGDFDKGCQFRWIAKIFDTMNYRCIPQNILTSRLSWGDFSQFNDTLVHTNTIPDLREYSEGDIFHIVGDLNFINKCSMFLGGSWKEIFARSITDEII